MDLNTTSFNIDELLSAYADNQIKDKQTIKEIKELLAKDKKLAAKYQSELLTKKLLQTRLNSTELPSQTHQRVMNSIDEIISKAKYNYQHSANYNDSNAYDVTLWQSIKNSLTGKLFGVPRYAFAAVIFMLIGTLVFFTGGKKTKNPYILAGVENNIMVQAVNSFKKVIKGEVKPQLTSSNAAEVEKYIIEKAKFDPYIPEIQNYSIAGVVCNDYKGQELAHIIYSNNNGQLIYIYQVPISAIQKKNLLLPEDVDNEIKNAKYYMCDEVDENDCTLMLWYKGDKVCASMSTMPKQEMYTVFTNINNYK